MSNIIQNNFNSSIFKWLYAKYAHGCNLLPITVRTSYMGIQNRERGRSIMKKCGNSTTQELMR